MLEISEIINQIRINIKQKHHRNISEVSDSVGTDCQYCQILFNVSINADKLVVNDTNVSVTS